MIYQKKFMTRLFSSLILAAFITCLLPQQGKAQIVDPLREYTNPDEIVTLDKNTTYSEAIEIINAFAQEYENKFIVDNSGYNGPVGVSLPPMYWKEALQYILRFQSLELLEYEDYYEIRPFRAELAEGENEGSSATGQPGQTEINTGTREVRINATFFEGNKRALREIGVDWSTLSSDAPENLGAFVSGNQTESLPATAFNDQFVSINSFGAQNVSQNAFNVLANLGNIAGNVSVQALFSAFEADNLGKVLATPSVKVVDGNEGNIQVGQDFSIKQRDIAGNVTDQFYQTGTILTVTPKIIDQDDTTFIYMDLQVERSTAQPDVVSTIINKQSASTSAILLDGESTHIAGLYRTEETSVRRGVPILKDLPPWFLGLRYLFGFDSKDYLENELIIIVQAELVKPISERIGEALQTKRMILDDERNRMRNDLDRVFENEKVRPLDVDDSIMDEEEPVSEEKKETARVKESEEVSTEEKLKDLSMPVKSPELMMVVPKAFSLDEYLEYKEQGIAVEEENTLKYFVIGGSFIVQDNAYNFMNTLLNNGYDARLLYNPASRYHFVAYEGFEEAETAVSRVTQIQQTVNENAWLFTLQENEELKE